MEEVFDVKIYYALILLLIIGIIFIFLFRNPTGYVIEQCIDNDNDKYGSSNIFLCDFSQLDCNDNNVAIHPEAEEICSDDIDNNCDGVSCLWRKCSDNDGNDITFKGDTITEIFNKDTIRNTGSGQKNEFHDKCKDEKIVIEGTCNGDIGEFKEIACQNSCSDGRCS